MKIQIHWFYRKKNLSISKVLKMHKFTNKQFNNINLESMTVSTRAIISIIFIIFFLKNVTLFIDMKKEKWNSQTIFANSSMSLITNSQEKKNLFPPQLRFNNNSKKRNLRSWKTASTFHSHDKINEQIKWIIQHMFMWNFPTWVKFLWRHQFFLLCSSVVMKYWS